MTDTLPPLHAGFIPDLPRRRKLAGFGHLLVAVIYALMLLAAPVIVRYAPAPSPTPIATATVQVAPHVDCAARIAACDAAATR